MKYFPSTVVASRLGGRAAVCAAIFGLSLAPSRPANAQESGAYLHVSYTRSQPPPGVNTDPGNYVGAGLTLRGETPHLYGFLRAVGRLDMSAEAPDWGEFSALAGAETFIGDRLAVGLAGSGFALGYSGPSRYRAWAGMLQPSVRAVAGRVGVMGQVRAWTGRTSVLEGIGGPLGGGQETTADLELLEGSLDLWVALGTASAGMGVDLSELRGAAYTTVRAWAGARATDQLLLSGSILVRTGENETEEAFVGTASYQVDRTVQLEATLSRTLPDLLLGSERTVAAALTVRFRLGDRARPVAVSPARETSVAEVVEDAGDATGRRVVRFRVAARADSVAVVGDFTGWEPSPMRPTSDSSWVAERALEPGVYRYAFIVDGSWYVPDGARGAVDDGFGQKNLILVVPAE